MTCRTRKIENLLNNLNANIPSTSDNTKETSRKTTPVPVLREPLSSLPLTSSQLVPSASVMAATAAPLGRPRAVSHVEPLMANTLATSSPLIEQDNERDDLFYSVVMTNGDGRSSRQSIGAKNVDVNVKPSTTDDSSASLPGMSDIPSSGTDTTVSGPTARTDSMSVSPNVGTGAAVDSVTKVPSVLGASRPPPLDLDVVNQNDDGEHHDVNSGRKSRIPQDRHVIIPPADIDVSPPVSTPFAQTPAGKRFTLPRANSQQISPMVNNSNPDLSESQATDSDELKSQMEQQLKAMMESAMESMRQQMNMYISTMSEKLTKSHTSVNNSMARPSSRSSSQILPKE